LYYFIYLWKNKAVLSLSEPNFINKNLCLFVVQQSSKGFVPWWVVFENTQEEIWCLGWYTIRRHLCKLLVLSLLFHCRFLSIYRHI
jgi:hypothetical protein